MEYLYSSASNDHQGDGPQCYYPWNKGIRTEMD